MDWKVLSDAKRMLERAERLEKADSALGERARKEIMDLLRPHGWTMVKKSKGYEILSMRQLKERTFSNG